MLPQTIQETWIEAFARGLRQEQDAYHLSLLGGDMISGTQDIAIAVTLCGDGFSDRLLSREGACLGDDVYVSGSLGDAAVGLALRRGALAFSHEDAELSRRFCTERLLLPTPRLSLGQQLVGLAHACIDVSDGLLADLSHLCSQNRGMRINADKLPMSETLRRYVPSNDKKRYMLAGGDDYELAWTAAQKHRHAIVRLAETCHVTIERIGSVDDSGSVHLYDDDGQVLDIMYKGYRHFADTAL